MWMFRDMMEMALDWHHTQNWRIHAKLKWRRVFDQCACPFRKELQKGCPWPGCSWPHILHLQLRRFLQISSAKHSMLAKNWVTYYCVQTCAKCVQDWTLTKFSASKQGVPESRTPKNRAKLKSLRRHLPTTWSVAQCHSTNTNFLCNFSPKETLFRCNLFVSHTSANSTVLYETNILEQNSNSCGEKQPRVWRIESHVFWLFVIVPQVNDDVIFVWGSHHSFVFLCALSPFFDILVCLGLELLKHCFSTKTALARKCDLQHLKRITIVPKIDWSCCFQSLSPITHTVPFLGHGWCGGHLFSLTITHSQKCHKSSAIKSETLRPSGNCSHLEIAPLKGGPAAEAQRVLDLALGMFGTQDAKQI